MVKVIRSFSLSPKTIQLIEKHVHDPALGQVQSRSAVVEQALLWYLDKRFKPFDTDNPKADWEIYDTNIAELAESQQKLMAKVRELAIEKHTPPIESNRSWWKRLLGI